MRYLRKMIKILLIRRQIRQVITGLIDIKIVCIFKGFKSFTFSMFHSQNHFTNLLMDAFITRKVKRKSQLFIRKNLTSELIKIRFHS